MKSSLKILDCTFRDGGYYNNWDFDKKNVENYINSIISSKVDIVEIGFRNFPQNKFLGPFAYSTDSFIQNLPKADKINLGVMSDASIFLDGNKISKNVKKLYAPKSESLVSLVRIASHFKDIENSRETIETLKELGYVVGFNLMQTGGKSKKEIENAVKILADWNNIDVLYFADSLGNMNEIEVVETIKIIKTFWDKDLGIHTHNNKGQALNNSIAALNNGVSWLDGTVSGMGRGAGNASTENLLREVNKITGSNYMPAELYILALEDFSKLKEKYGWGPSLLYSLAAEYNIHPTYIQEMLSDQRYSNTDILEIIEKMKSLPSKSFNKDNLENIKYKKSISKKGEWNAKDWCKDKDVLIIGNGPSSEKYKQDIEQYIKKYKPLVLSLNIQMNISKSLIDGYIAGNQSRVSIESKFYSDIDKTIYTSKDLFSVDPKIELNTPKIKDYGLSIDKNQFCIDTNGCIMPFPLSALYAFSIVSIGNAKKIYLVGFDGYDKNDYRQEKMVTAINMYKKDKNSINLISLTPTSYPIIHSSLYAPR